MYYSAGTKLSGLTQSGIIWFVVFFISFHKELPLLTFNKGNKVFVFRIGIPSQNLKTMTHLKAGPPLDLSFWSFLTFLHHGIEEVERHLPWKFYKNIRRKSWSNVPPKLLACIGFLYKVVHKIGPLRKFSRFREIEFNFFTAWTISMKFGTLVQHAPGYKTVASDFLIFAWGLSYGLSKSIKRGKIVTKLWKIITKSLGKN